MAIKKDFTGEMKHILATAEMEVRGLIGAAANVGDYDFLERARRIAIGLQAMNGGPQPSVVTVTPQISERTKSRSGTPSSEKTRHEKESYPHFRIKGDQLIRTGWSKKKKSEYNHKVSREVFDRVVAVLSPSCGENSPTQAEDWMKKLDATGDDALPSYQFYVVVGFLRDEGLIQQVGREGYVVPEGFAGAVQSLWPR